MENLHLYHRYLQQSLPKFNLAPYAYGYEARAGGEGPIQFGYSTINLSLGWVVQYIFWQGA